MMFDFEPLYKKEKGKKGKKGEKGKKLFIYLFISIKALQTDRDIKPELVFVLLLIRGLQRTHNGTR